MADFPMSDFSAPGRGSERAAPAAPKREGRQRGMGGVPWANWAGAAASLALVAGGAVWGFNLVRRDVAEVPVVKALAGDLRVAPKGEEAGGLNFANQGLAVNQVPAENPPLAQPGGAVLAPAPQGLQGEDTVGLVVPAPVALPGEGAAPAVADGSEVLPIAPSEAKSIEALADQIAAGLAPRPGSFEGTPSEVAAVEVVPGGIGRSLRPRGRPARILQSPAPVPEAAAQIAPPAPVVATPASIPDKTPMMQLGAFGSESIARSEWERHLAKFGAYLEDKNPIIQKASSGGKVFYRLRVVGFEDLSDAVQVCSALKAEKADCIAFSKK